MVDYDSEADAYDATRGGVPRAEAAAQAVLGLLPHDTATLLDLGCGTGIVTSRLDRPGLRVFGLDASPGMARMALGRGVPVALASATRLPLADARVDAVSAVWLLHLLCDPGAVAAVVAEAGRVLRPGGVFVTTVDKDAGHDVGSDVDAVLAAYRRARASDEADAVTAYAASAGLRPAGRARFRGHGQGRTPNAVAQGVLAGRYASLLEPQGTAPAELAARLGTLPAPDTPRGEPTYELRAFVRT
ncbi:SAM-dependent methyltransferase [Streptomyces venezuelae]|uniref:SAM-dependent methyltransferase n=1 Tax=Streptomyces venezuelae TaxID=54571 RepID=A0A5P2DG20_STRVZ|nr:class I SAM-dependent methyltransferase [Streptomyces venezuelae]QES52191.1 SAM-dependent methyltransferase [Streptomyces venezuelae]